MADGLIYLYCDHTGNVTSQKYQMISNPTLPCWYSNIHTSPPHYVPIVAETTEKLVPVFCLSVKLSPHRSRLSPSHAPAYPWMRETPMLLFWEFRKRSDELLLVHQRVVSLIWSASPTANRAVSLQVTVSLCNSGWLNWHWCSVNS